MSHCTECNSRLMFSARQSGRGLCGPCRRRADGESTTADLANFSAGNDQWGLLQAAMSLQTFAMVAWNRAAIFSVGAWLAVSQGAYWSCAVALVWVVASAYTALEAGEKASELRKRVLGGDA